MFHERLSFSIQTNLWNGQGEFLLIKWKRTCGLGVVNTSRHTSHPWSSMFPYGLCPSGIAGVLIIKHSKNGSWEAVDKGSIDLGDTALIISSKENKIVSGLKTHFKQKRDVMFSNIFFMHNLFHICYYKFV